MKGSFRALIDDSKLITIALPADPNFDQVAGGLALYLTLKKQKDVQVFCPTPMIVEFNRIIGVDRVSQELGNKNLIIKFVNYEASDIEKVIWDTEGSVFMLSVTPNPGKLPPSRENVQLSYSGFSGDCLILIGGETEASFPFLNSREFSFKNTIHIGVRDLNLNPGKNYISFSRPKSCISELIFSIIKDSELSLDEDISTNLLMGIEKATESFTSSSVTYETFAVVSELMRAGGKRLSQQIREQVSFPQAFPFTPPFVTGTNSQKIPPVTPINEEDSLKKPPQDWLKPKIFRGASDKSRE